MNTVNDRCPWCGSEIPHARFIQIESKIRKEEREKLATSEAAIRKQLEEKFRQNLQGQKRAMEKAGREEAEKRLAKIAAERDVSLNKVKKLEAREATLRQQVQEQAERNVRKILKQSELERRRELNDQRSVLEKDRDRTLLKKESEFNRQREAFQEKFVEMERQLQRKTANEIEEGAEIDLYESLRDNFTSDRIMRVKKGQPGADILYEVLYKGEPCGRIVIDSKNRQAWQYTFLTKLRKDQVDAGAEHAILSTTVFPSGNEELCIESDVIVISPARVVHMITLLRRAMIELHVRGLSVKERTGKMAALYKFITSEVYMQRFKEAGKLTNDILDLDVAEKKVHDNTWKKRGALAKGLGNVLREIDTDITAIIEARGVNEVAAA